MNWIKTYLTKPVEKLFNWVEHFANTKYRMHALWWTSFTESSFFIVPPDLLVMAIAMHRRVSPLKLAIFTGVASTLGGVFGYYLGMYFFDMFGNRILEFYNIKDSFNSIGELFNENAAMVIFLKTFIPVIPYKVFALAAGVFKVNIWSFIIASFIGRTIRFYIVASLSYKYGLRAKDMITKRLDIFFVASLVFILALVLIFKI